MSRRRVLILVGATASGKSAQAVHLAGRLGAAEIISADSRQVYRYMDIGTATPTERERAGVPHHGLDIVDPDQRYTAGHFSRDARRWIDEIHGRGHVAIVAGGTGLWLQALVDGLPEATEAHDVAVREQLQQRLDHEGLAALYTELQRRDPEYAGSIAAGDTQRVLRALEAMEASGRRISELRAGQAQQAQFDTRWFGLRWTMRSLKSRIALRAGEMIDRGLIAETRSLLERGYGDCDAMKSVGYREARDLLAGRLPSLEQMKEQLVLQTRRYAKRQRTWFRREGRIHWLDGEQTSRDERSDQLQRALDW